MQGSNMYLKRWGIPIAATAGIATMLWLVSSALDFHNSRTADTLLGVLFLSNPDTGRYLLTSIAQSLAAVLGITMMVVLLVVQLAAARYSHNLIELYIEDRFNTVLVSAFVGCIIYSSWVANTIKADFVPSLGTLVALLLATGCFLSLIPYFRHVFSFLEAEVVVSRLERKAEAALETGGSLESQKELIQRIGQIGRIATTSISQMETDVALTAVSALERICLRDLTTHAVNAETVCSIEKETIELLNQVYRLALGKARDVAYAAAITGRVIAEAAMTRDRSDLSRDSLKLLNTMLRAGINEKDSLTIYHVLHQYRLLAEALIDHCDDRVLDVYFYFKYYALTSQQAGIRFIIDTAAYDLNILCQKGLACQSPLLDRMLESFLDMEGYLEKHGQAPHAFSVRKMYGVLAAHLLAKERHDLAAPLLERIQAAPPAETERLKEELLSGPTEPFFWEFTERKVNFDYLGEQERASLRPYLDTVAVS